MLQNYQNGKPVSAHSIVVSIQHESHLSIREIRDKISPIVELVLPWPISVFTLCIKLKWWKNQNL